MPIRSVGGEFTVNTTLDGAKYNSRAFALDGGKFAIGWMSYDPTYYDENGFYDESIGMDIIGRVFYSDGSATTDEIKINQSYDFPDISNIISLEDGGFIVQWGTGFVADEYELDLFTRAFDANGLPEGDQTEFNNGADHNSLIHLSDGRFLSTWMDWAEVSAQFLDKSGNRIGDPFRVDTLNIGYETSPEAVELPNGRILFLWNSDYPLFDSPIDPKGISILGRVFDRNGVPLGREFQINALPTYALDSPDFNVTPQADGTTLVTWWGSRGEWDSVHMMGRILDKNGQPVGDSEFHTDFIRPVDLQEGFYSITELADGRSLVTWSIHEEETTSIHAQMRNNRGDSISDEFLIEAKKYADVAALNDGRIVLSWTVPNGSGADKEYPGLDVVAQIFNPKIFDGTEGDDFWTGGAFIDRINGGDGNDRLRGMEGEDRIHGGNGNDFLDGSEGDDFLWGDAGNDILAGWTGIDTMTGGTGNDTYVVDRLEDVVLENAGEGIDTVQSYISLRLGANVEHLLLKGRGDTSASGNALANALTGNAGDNRLRGGDGADLLDGGRGADRLEGGAGRDRLIGGDGADQLFGGTGKDRFIFLDAAETGVGAARDSIRDFTRGADLIDLGKIDADATHAGNQAFHFRGAAAFSGDAGELRFAAGILSGDIDGDARADFQIEIAGIARLGDADILG